MFDVCKNLKKKCYKVFDIHRHSVIMCNFRFVFIILSLIFNPVYVGSFEDVLTKLFSRLIPKNNDFETLRFVFNRNATVVPWLLDKFYAYDKVIQVFDDRNITSVFKKINHRIDPRIYIIESDDESNFMRQWAETERRRHFSNAKFFIIVGREFDNVTGLFEVIEQKFIWNAFVLKIFEEEIHVYYGRFNCKKIEGINMFIFKGQLDADIDRNMYEYKNCTLRISTEHWPPYVIKENGHLDGVEVRLVEEFARIYNFSLVYNDLDIGPDGIWPSIVDSVRENKSDLGFCALIVSDSLNGTDSTKSYWSFSLSFVAPDSDFVPKWRLTARALGVTNNLVILTTALIFFLAALFIARRSTGDNRYKSSRFMILLVFGTLYGQSLKQPSTILLRFIFSAWYLYTILINVVFNTALTTSATLPERAPQIDSLDRLVRTELPLLVSRKMDFIVELLEDENLKKYIETYSVVGLFDRLAVARRLSRYKNFSMLVNMEHVDFVTGGRRGNYHVLPEKLLTSNMAIIVQRGDKIVDLLDDFCLKVSQHGLVHKWHSDSFKYSHPAFDLMKETPDHLAPLTVTDLLFPFIFMTFFYIISIIIFFVEQAHFMIKNKRKNERPSILGYGST